MYFRNVYCAYKKNTFQTVHKKCVLCTETEHFLDSTRKASFTDYKKLLRTKLSDLQPFICVYIHIYIYIYIHTNICTQHKLKVTPRLHAGSSSLLMPFNLSWVLTLVLQIMAGVMQVMGNVKCGMYSFHVRHNLIVSLRHFANAVILLSDNCLLPTTICSQN